MIPRRMRTVPLALFGGIALFIAIAGVGGCPPIPTETRGSGPGTVVDVHGQSGVGFLIGGQCDANAAGFPSLPDAWWAGVSPTVRQKGAVVGYQTFANSTLPNPCPRVFRTDVYRAFYTVDLSPYAGRSGSIIKATAKLTALSVGGDNGAFPPLTGPFPTNAFGCDKLSGAAAQLVQVAGAMVVPTGLTMNVLSSGQFDLSHPPIPDSYPAGPVIFNFPPKDPTLPASLGHPTFEADITQLVVNALAANVTTLKFMVRGTNEPTKVTNAPDSPQRNAPVIPMVDCRGVFSFVVDLQAA